MRIITCHESFAQPILAILNEAILTSTALYDYKPRTLDSMAAWFAAKGKGGYPLLGAVSDQDELLGFASYGPFRAWPAYKYSIEHSVYVHKDHRRQGIGRALMQRLIAAAAEQQYHMMVGGIDIANTPSITLHANLGFMHAGTIRHAGFKFGKWLDLGFYQLLLETPACPVDG